MMRTMMAAGALSLAMLLANHSAPAQESARSSDELLERWFALYEQHAGSIDMQVDTESDRDLELQLPPLLKYTNPVRGVQQHGSIFVWTLEGRPAVIASICSALDREHPGQRRVNYEWHSLLVESVIATREGEHLWNSAEPGVEWQPVTMPLDVAGSRRLRLAQMRRIAQWFNTRIEAEEGELRLMSQPIYRYPEHTPDVLDGAVFAVVMGTDPELLVLLEARSHDDAEPEWHVAFARFTNAALSVLQEQQEIWSCGRARAFQQTGRFFLWFAVERHPADLDIDSDRDTQGSE